MKKIFYFFVPILFSSALLSGQTLSPQVTSTSGNGEASLTWTIGQIMCNTYSSSSSTLTQGFQQPGINITSSLNAVNSTDEIFLYPNPTKGLLIIHTKFEKKQKVYLYDNKGVLVDDGNFSGNFELDLSKLKPGIYLLKINSDTFKVVKL